MNEQLIEILEGQGLDQKQIADIMAEISQVNIGVLDPTTPLQGNSLTQIENELRDKMDAEIDWRNRAKLAARIISLNLE